ncbi:MAG: hypothetical protein ACRDHN_18870, partial [Thermomicrobiales bacterium]
MSRPVSLSRSMPRLCCLLVAVVLVMCGIAQTGQRTSAAPADSSTWETRSSTWGRFHFNPDLQADSAVSPDAFVSTFGETVDTAVNELSLVAGVDVASPIDIWVTTSYQSSGIPVLSLFDPSDG